MQNTLEEVKQVLDYCASQEEAIITYPNCGRKVHISMPSYIDKALTQFQHERPKRLQNSPHKHIAPNYGAKAQYVKPNCISPLLDKEQKKYVQAVTGTLLYYAQAVDPTILIALNAIATQQAAPMQNTLE